MGFRFGSASEKALRGVHPDLVKVARRAIQLTDTDFRVLEGLRSLERQKQLKAKGASTIIHSRHITGHAIDVCALLDGKVSWHWPLYTKISKAFLQAAKEMKVPLTWGGSWKSFPDGGHFELPRKQYPA